MAPKRRENRPGLYVVRSPADTPEPRQGSPKDDLLEQLERIWRDVYPKTSQAAWNRFDEVYPNADEAFKQMVKAQFDLLPHEKKNLDSMQRILEALEARPDLTAVIETVKAILREPAQAFGKKYADLLIARYGAQSLINASEEFQNSGQHPRLEPVMTLTKLATETDTDYIHIGMDVKNALDEFQAVVQDPARLSEYVAYLQLKSVERDPTGGKS